MDSKEKITAPDEVLDEINTANTASADENDDEGRPPVDPNNKLYTVLSLLIFAVLYIGWNYLKSSVSFTYALYENDPSESCMAIVLREIDMDGLPDGFEVDYLRLNRGFDENAFYISLQLPEDMSEEDFLSYIPYEYGNIIEDERFNIYPHDDMDAHYVFGNCYVCVEDPKKSCLIYEEDGRLNARFRTADYSEEVPLAMKEGVKLNADLGRNDR